MDNIELAAAIAARTKLASLNTGRFGRARAHPGETREENLRHNTDAARVSVKLSNHRALTELASLHSAARNAHKLLTVPTVADGMRLLPAGRELEHAATMSKFADRHDELVREFIADYPAEAAAAPARLNGLYVASMWPPVEAMPSKFTFRTRYMSTPSDGSWGDWLIESSRAARDDLKERIVEALTRLRDRCSADGRLYASVFEAVHGLVDLVSDLDFDGSFAPIVQEMTPLATLKADVLRDDHDGRKAAARKADRILSVLGNIS